MTSTVTVLPRSFWVGVYSAPVAPRTALPPTDHWYASLDTLGTPAGGLREQHLPDRGHPHDLDGPGGDDGLPRSGDHGQRRLDHGVTRGRLDGVRPAREVPRERGRTQRPGALRVGDERPERDRARLDRHRAARCPTCSR